MKTFRITLTREISQDLHLEIEAENTDEARERAEDEILNLAEDDWRILQETDPEVAAVVELRDDGESDEQDAPAAAEIDEEAW
jgi:hypothetical protein